MIGGKKYVFPNLVAQMAINGDELRTLSSEIGIGYQALSARMQGKKAFELPEISALMQKYNKPFDYLFENKTTESRAS